MFVFSTKRRLGYLLSTSDGGIVIIGACKGGCLRTKHVR